MNQNIDNRVLQNIVMVTELMVDAFPSIETIVRENRAMTYILTNQEGIYSVIDLTRKNNNKYADFVREARQSYHEGLLMGLYNKDIGKC